MRSLLWIRKLSISLILVILLFSFQPLFLPKTSYFTTDAQAMDVATMFSGPLGFRDGMKSGI